MKLNEDLIREILFAVDDLPPTSTYEEIHLKDWADNVVNFHIAQLQRAELIEADIKTNILDELECYVRWLTPKGQEVVKRLRENRVLKAVKAGLARLDRDITVQDVVILAGAAYKALGL